jgi:hypothetical protein
MLSWDASGDSRLVCLLRSLGRFTLVCRLKASRRCRNCFTLASHEAWRSQWLPPLPDMETENKFDQSQKIRLAIVDNGLVISCPNVTKWTEWMEESFVDGTHWIATDDIQGFHVETVFLGINHNIPDVEPPLWFETMVFRESANGTHGVKIKYDTLRSSTVADALANGAAPKVAVRMASSRCVCGLPE